MTRRPFSDPSAPDEWVYTNAGRIPCESCGEWIYTRRHAAGGPAAFSPVCQVCGADTPGPLSPVPGQDDRAPVPGAGGETDA